VIQLPPDLFFGTTIATCVIVLKKSKSDNSVLFIDASDQFKRFGNKNKLTTEHQQAILDAYTGRTDRDHVTKLVRFPPDRRGIDNEDRDATEAEEVRPGVP
uniref:N-6 DNA methylase n=1 Tax=uncultured Paracoccus sp. TaxID=189685 RepID=UPI00351A1115